MALLSKWHNCGFEQRSAFFGALCRAKKKAPEVTGALTVEVRMLWLRQSVSCRHWVAPVEQIIHPDSERLNITTAVGESVDEAGAGDRYCKACIV